MSLAQSLRDLKSAATAVTAWLESYLPEDDDPARCLEFAVLLDAASQLATATSVSPQVVVGPKNSFAGSPANRLLYNLIEVGDYLFHLGVCFEGQSGTAHAPDVAVSHKAAPDRPIVILECKHYSGDTLPKPVVMAFVGLLCDLQWSTFENCAKLGSTGLYPGKTLQALAGVPRDASVCETFNTCRSQLVTTIRPSQPLSHLESRYHFEVVLAPSWQEAEGAATNVA